MSLLHSFYPSFRMDAVFGVFRGFMGPDASEQEKQLDVFRGLFGGMPTDAVKRFVNDLEERAVRQRHEVVPALREASEQKYAAAQRRGVRNPNAPSPAELQHPAWSEFNIAKDAHARGQKLLQLQDRAVKMLLEFSGREEEFLPAPLRRCGFYGMNCWNSRHWNWCRNRNWCCYGCWNYGTN